MNYVTKVEVKKDLIEKKKWFSTPAHQLGAIKYFAFQGALPRLQNIFDNFFCGTVELKSAIICEKKYA